MGRPDSPSDSQWAVFARNHDELTLDKLSGAERLDVFQAFGPDEGMQVYGRGLRRRLPTMLDGDQLRLRMVYSLMLSLPGTPTLFYGEEIGMAENLELPGRMAVRTPMQWRPGATGGFSSVDDPRALCRPFPPAPFGPDQINVVAQRHDPTSLMSFVRGRIRCYQECPELGWGAVTVLDHDARSVLAHRCDWSGGTVLLVHNLGATGQIVRLTLTAQQPGSCCVDLFDRTARHPLTEDGELRLDVEPWAALWFRVVQDASTELL